MTAWPVRRAALAVAGVWIGLQSTINSVSVTSDLARRGVGFHAAEPWIWEFSGGLSAFVLLWPVLVFDEALRRRLRGTASRAAAWVLGSVGFSVAHVLLMVAMREAVYRGAGWHYDFGPWLAGGVYEYRKDAFSFLLMIAGAALLRRLRARAPAAEHRPEPPPEAALPAGAPPTFIVRSGQGDDLLVRADEIDWIEAQGNYVALHLGPEVRLLRQTMAETEARLQAHGFVRTHRRALVNRQRIAALLPAGSSDAGVRLRSGAVAPLSESRRAALVRLVRDT